MADFLTSDQHYGHANSIIKSQRPFHSVEEMNEIFIANHNEVVGPQDRVFVLGDFSLSMKWVDEIGPRLNGFLFLVPGNHDHIHSCFDNSEIRHTNLTDRYFNKGRIQVIAEHCEIEFGDVKVLMSHLPYWEETSNPHKARYQAFRPEPQDEYALLCGHVHHYWKIRRHRASGKIMYNVGVDVQNYKPVSVEQVFADINEYILKESNGTQDPDDEAVHLQAESATEALCEEVRN